SFKDGDTIEVSKVVLLMITMSDNTASLWLQKLVGTDYINNWLEVNGFKVMRDNSRATNRDAMHRRYGWGVTTPYEMCRLFTMIRNGKAVALPPASACTVIWAGFFGMIKPYRKSRLISIPYQNKARWMNRNPKQCW